MTTISVVIPTYNAEAVIARSVRSVLSQKGDFEVEVIVCDDASTDATAEIARDLGARVLTSETNSGGPNRGRNRGLREGDGEWFCLLDQDDAYHPGKLQRQLEVGLPVMWTGYLLEDAMRGTTEVRGEPSADPVIHEPDEAFLRWMQRDRAQMPYLSSLMLHRSLAHVCFEEHFGVVDYDYYLRLLEHQQTAYLPEPLVTRHVSGDNLSLDEEYRRLDYYYSLMVLEEYRAAYPRQVRRAERRINGTRARYYYLKGEMPRARRHFLRSSLDPKTLMYLLTSFAGSSLVRRHFRIFG
jgi:glycosyltransferase involved in cell wall biosynthesis